MKRLLLFTLFFAIVSTAKAQNDPSLTVGDTGTITFQYRGNTVTYTTVRAADGLIWLQQNLGATQVADSATDTAAYGHYFQWGRWDDGHQVPTSDTAHAHGLAINNPAGIPNGSDKFFVDTSAGANPWWANGDSNNTWTNAPPSDSNGYDPCAALGPNWHMPSKSEFSNLVAIEGISANTSAFSSNLKLPMAGTRHYIDTFFIGVHNSSAYWTSSVVDSLANTVYITSTVDTNHPVYKGYGRSVRCVTTCTGVYSPDTLLGPDTVCANSVQTWQTPRSPMPTAIPGPYLPERVSLARRTATQSL
ncbi:MAG: hypothetical protein JNL72_04775 [Flavipsychrobacter sp.]|nr:hypothetical protein [Flavipsychrobacter sp.]